MPSLADVPFLSGYLGQQAVNRTAGDDVLRQATGYMTLQGQARASQESGMVRSILESDAPPEEKQKALMRFPAGMAVLEHMQKVTKTQQEIDLNKQFSGANTGAMGPDQLDALGQRLALGGHPGAATVMNIADKRRQTEAARAQMPVIQSQEQPVTESPVTDAGGVQRSQVAPGGPMVQPPNATEPVPPEVAAAMSSGQPFSVGVGPSSNPAENMQKVGGMFAPFLQSTNPAIRQEAVRMQAYVNSLTPQSLTPTLLDRLEKRAEALGTMQAQGSQQQAAAQFRVDNRAPAQTERIPVGYRRAADGTSIERIPVAGGTTASADAIRDDAFYSIINGKARPGSIPTGRDEGNRYREQLREEISKVSRELGMTPQQLASLGGENKAKFVALNAVEKDLAAIRPFDNMLDTNVKIAIDLAKKIADDRTGSQYLNRPITWLEQNAADNPDIAEYLFQIQTVKTEGARILNNPRLVGQLTDSARHEMGEVINGNMPLGQTERVLKRMLSDGKNRVKAIETEADTLRSDIRGSAGGKPKAPDVESAVKASGYPYEPNKYEYRVGIGGQVQRKAK